MGIHLPKISCSLVERLIKVFKNLHKCHRNILGQEKKVLDSVVYIMMRSSVQPLYKSSEDTIES